jgi:hypothetical protein
MTELAPNVGRLRAIDLTVTISISSYDRGTSFKSLLYLPHFPSHVNYCSLYSPRKHLNATNLRVETGIDRSIGAMTCGNYSLEIAMETKYVCSWEKNW